MTTASGDTRSRVLRVVEVREETEEAKSLVFAIPERDRELFSYRPGQFVTIRIPSGRTGSVARCYSISSCPTEERLSVTVKRVDGGYGSNWLCDNVTAGTSLEVLPPSGAFTPKSLDGDFLLIGAGSGITPLLSITKAVLRCGTGKVTLFYANRDEKSVVFRDELRELAVGHRERLTVLHWLESLQGMPHRTRLAPLLAPHVGAETYLCGPQPFMEQVRQALAEHGAADGVHVEKFTSLSGDPFTERSPTPAPASVPDSEAAGRAVSVIVGGEEHEIHWSPGSVLLDALLDEGVDVPFSCFDGECGTCRAELVQGKVRMGRAEGLTEDEVEKGAILACVTEAPDDSDPTRIVVRFP